LTIRPSVGYCPWSAIDLVSTHQGIGKRWTASAGTRR
jgi:beta-glucosidase/6-phospho-beta-glucosidase/beta-galactosidase